MTTAPDAWRSRVYSAEDQFTALLNRGGRVDFFGSHFDLSPQRRFGDLASVRDYVHWVFDLVSPQYPEVRTPAIRARKGKTRAHYEYATQIIALPISDQWALRETVILHECAHHITWITMSGKVAAHGPEFTQVMLHLVGSVLGEPAELLLRVGYQEAGVPIKTSKVKTSETPL